MAVRIGLPQGLLYYQYGAVWKRFLQELGAEVVVSSDTSKTTLDRGGVLDEVCLPVKVYFGHIYELAARNVDYLFTPRIISVSAGQYCCPKIIGMPDILQNNMDRLPPLMDAKINLRQNDCSLYQAVASAGRMLGKNPLFSLYAWYSAWKCHRREQPCFCPCRTNRRRIGLIGHSYIIHDRQISMDIIGKLSSLGFEVITPEMVSLCQAAAAAKSLNKKIFWSTSHHMAGAALALIQSAPPVDGLILMTSFACGPDALIGELIKRRAQGLNIPCMLLTVDEHTAEAGFVTRLEAFTDMLIRRKQPC